MSLVQSLSAALAPVVAMLKASYVLPYVGAIPGWGLLSTLAAVFWMHSFMAALIAAALLYGAVYFFPSARPIQRTVNAVQQKMRQVETAGATVDTARVEQLRKAREAHFVPEPSAPETM